MAGNLEVLQAVPRRQRHVDEDTQAVQAALTSKTGRVRKTNFFARRGTPMDSVGLSDLGKQLLYCDENGTPTKKKTKTSQVVITTEDGRKLGGFTSCPKASEACG